MAGGVCCLVYGFALKMYSPSCCGVIGELYSSIGFPLLWYVVSCGSPCPHASLRQGVIPQSDGQASPTRAPGSSLVLQRGQDGPYTARLIECPEPLEQSKGTFEELPCSGKITHTVVQGSLSHPSLGHFVTSSHLFQALHRA